MLKYFQKYLFQINCGAKYVFFYFQNKFFSFLNLDFYKNFLQIKNQSDHHFYLGLVKFLYFQNILKNLQGLNLFFNF